MQSQLALVMPEVTLSAGVAELDLDAPDGTLLRGHAEAARSIATRRLPGRLHPKAPTRERTGL